MKHYSFMYLSTLSGSPNGLVAYPGRLFTPDFVRCDEGRTIAILKCVQSMFDPDARTCGLKLDTGWIFKYNCKNKIKHN